MKHDTLLFVSDSCTQKVCRNGGTPVGGITICECKCPPGFTGPNCERGQLQETLL